MRLPILGYHKVGAEAEIGRRLNIDPARLDSHVRFFKRRGYGFVTGNELAGAWTPRSVAFTFDDGFAGAVDDGLGTLSRHGGRGTVYVVTDQVGGVSSWQGERPFPLAGWDELRAAAAKGHEVGNHTRTHARLSELDNDAQIAEIEGAAQALAREKLQGGSFCLPYGSYGPETRALVAQAGYSVGMSVRKAVATEADDRLLLPRIFIAFGAALPLLVYRIWVRPL
jgi:peptidoglycan/xylan/chitin deacetylase (PgdA/CDA1 family)